jgi:hypothetical protein
VEVEVEAMSPYGEVSSEGTLLLTVIVQPEQEPSLPFLFLLPVVGLLVLILVLVKLRR